jgi:hypothetical protein
MAYEDAPEPDGFSSDEEWTPADDGPQAHDETPNPAARLTLYGGPLAGRTALQNDTRFRLFVGKERGKLVVACALDESELPDGIGVLGYYEFIPLASGFLWRSLVAHESQHPCDVQPRKRGAWRRVDVDDDGLQPPTH